jgi:methyl-accepting chemotaxis protein
LSDDHKEEKSAMFGKMKVKSRLALGFSLVLILMVVIIGFSLYQGEVSNEKLEHIITINNVRVQKANNMLDRARESSIVVRDILLSKNNNGSTEEIQNHKNHLSEIRKSYDELIAANRKLISADDAEGFKRISDLEVFEQTARQMQDRMIKLALAGKGVEANDFKDSTAYPKVKEWANNTAC